MIALLNDRDALKLLDQKQKGKPIEVRPVVSALPAQPSEMPSPPPLASMPPRPAIPPVSVPGQRSTLVITMACIYIPVKLAYEYEFKCSIRKTAVFSVNFALLFLNQSLDLVFEEAVIIDE